MNILHLLANIPIMKKDCNWKIIKVLAYLEVERVTFSKLGYIFVYIYLFTLRLSKKINPIILELCRNYQVCLAQVGPTI